MKFTEVKSQFGGIINCIRHPTTQNNKTAASLDILLIDLKTLDYPNIVCADRLISSQINKMRFFWSIVF